MPNSPCKHESFAAEVDVSRLEDTGQFSADIRIKCEQCRLPFQFLGLPAGLDLKGAAMSPDGLEARLAIVPQGAEPSPLDEGLILGLRVRDPGDH